jgi:RluA family pseudouridine synthase
LKASIKLSWPATRQFWDIPVLWEDRSLLALDKPGGLLTSPDRYDPRRPNLMKLLHRDIERRALWTRERQLTYLENAHRLDFETSGVILLAKDRPTLMALADQFGSEKPNKAYVALVHGSPLEEDFQVDAKLAPHPARMGMTRVDPKRGKKSKTLFTVVERFSGFALLRCQPLTARTHQIRVHLRHAGFPVVGDLQYGGCPLALSALKSGYKSKRNETERPLIGRVALHAEALTIVHPATGAPVAMTAPWPNDLTVALKYLERYARNSSAQA